MKYALTAIVALLVGGFGGGYIGGQLGGKGGAVLGMCELAKVAVAKDYLSEDQLFSLAKDTGADMQRNYPSIADRLELSEESRGNATSGSDCSQFLLRLNEGMDSVK